MFNESILETIINEYKDDFERVHKQEIYKWKAVKWFQDNWDADAENFAEMLENALSSKMMQNLLDSRNRLPRAMICRLAKKDPEAVRSMFINLYNENEDLTERIERFIARAEELRQMYNEGRWNSHYQSSNSVSAYLWLRRPEKYYYFKFTSAKAFAQRIEYPNLPIRGRLSDVQVYFEMCDEILRVVRLDDELIRKSKNRLQDDDYADENLRLLVYDIVHFGSRPRVSMRTFDDTSPIGISKEQWLEMLNKPEIISPNEVNMLRKWLHFDGMATCAEVSKAFKEHSSAYNAPASSMGKRVQAHTGCVLIIREKGDDLPMWWNIPFTGRYISSGEHFQWTIRPELHEALKESGLQPYALPSDDGVEYTPYDKDDFLREVYMSELDYDSLSSLLKRKKNVILQGAPGVGKTYAAKRLAYSMLGRKDELKIKVVQFHQSYSYEDFIMGFRPSKSGYELKEGVFYQFCSIAAENPDDNFFFIIDEINRGNLSKIFGEILMMIEEGYRGAEVTLAYDNERSFSVPENLYIIGMMNTADRSLALIDYALRRRFSFFEMQPAFYSDSKGFDNYIRSLNSAALNELIDMVKQLNQVILDDQSLGEGFLIGHSYFCEQDECTSDWLSEIVNYDLIPILKEYWFDNKKLYEDWAKKLREAVNDD